MLKRFQVADRGERLAPDRRTLHALEELYRRFDAKDPVFDPPISTFEPTKKEANVPNVNTIPATDVFYYDCRVLPCYALEEIEAEGARLVKQVEARHRVTITDEPAQRAAAAPSTPVDAAIVKLLAAGIHEVYHVAGVLMGVGGGTVAAHIRRRGFPVAVWSWNAFLAAICGTYMPTSRNAPAATAQTSTTRLERSPTRASGSLGGPSGSAR